LPTPDSVRLREQIERAHDLQAWSAETFARASQPWSAPPGEGTTIYTCPDCGGVMWQDGSEPVLGFRCHVGHAYAPEVLLGQKSEELEAALWSSVRLLKEKATLTRQLAERTRATGNRTTAARIAELAELDEQHAQAIRALLESMPNPADQTMMVVENLDASA